MPVAAPKEESKKPEAAQAAPAQQKPAEAKPAASAGEARDPKLTPEILAGVDALVKMEFDAQQAKATPEQRKAEEVYMEKYAKDAKFAAAENATYEKRFKDADVNKNGVLTMQEYKVFMKACIAADKATGKFVNEDEKQMEQYYLLVDKYNPQTQGIAFADMMGLTDVFMEKFEAYKAAHSKPAANAAPAQAAPAKAPAQAPADAKPA